MAAPFSAELPEASTENLVKALERSNIYYFRYFPKKKTAVIPDNTCAAWNCLHIYEDMPDGLGKDFVLDADRPQFDAMYKAIDEGAPSACSVFRLKDMKTWSRVTITTNVRDSDGNPEECTAIVENLSAEKEAEKEFSERNHTLNAVMQVFQVASEATGTIVFIFDCEKQSILVTDTTANQWGILTEQTGVPYEVAESGIVAEESKAEYIRCHEEIMKGYMKSRGRIKLRDSAGNVGYFELTMQALLDENGKPTGKAAGIYKNFTEYQENYMHQYAMTRALSDGIASAYYIDFDEDTFIIEKISDSLRTSVTSYVQESKKCFSETITGYCRKFVHEEDLDRMLYEMKNSTIVEKLAAKHSYYIQYRVKVNNERYSFFEIHVADASEKEGEHKAFMSFRCIDEQKEKELEHQQILSSFSGIYFASWVINAKTCRITELSVPEYACYVAKDSEADAQKAMELIIERCVALDADKEKMQKFLDVSTIFERLGDQSTISAEFLSKSLGWCTANIIPISSGHYDRPADYLLAIKQIDAEKKNELQVKKALEDAYEAANRANTAKSDFLSNMSHDIRTPINAIIGMTAIAYTHIDEKEKVRDCLSKITVSGKHLLGIINDVLDMSKIESGKLDLNIEDFDLAELVDNLITMSKPQIEAMHHTLTVDIHGIEHELVTGDSQRIQQVFMNLMSNAIKYTPEGGKIRLSITEKPTNKAKIGCYEFIFEDNGIGMTEEFQKHLFEPFSREMNSEMKNRQGTGLGMPITQNIVRMMNGTITVDSAVGKGTKFTVTIFLSLQDGDNNRTDEMLLDQAVLIANDDEITCISACDTLKELGMTGDWVLSGKEAIEKVTKRHEENNDYFAVILDWKMPEMDGFETAKRLRQAVGDSIPIIIVSAYDWSAIEQEARAAGVDAFISKPMFKSRMYHTFRTIAKNDGQSDALDITLDNIASQSFKGKRVLLAEDNELNAEIACEILGMADITVDLAGDGAEAVNMARKVPEGYYDLIFMDIQMPVMNGYEAAREIRASESEHLKSVPIVAMTANAFAEDVEAARSAGMNDHVAKPIDFDQLVKALNKWLNGKNGK